MTNEVKHFTNNLGCDLTTPKDGYNAKIKVIVEAKDLSSQEKLSEITKADNHYTTIGIVNSGLKFFEVAGVCILACYLESPQGRKKICDFFDKYF